MTLDATENKHNYRGIYQHISLGDKTITPQNFLSWAYLGGQAHLGGLALTDTTMIFCSLYKVQTRAVRTLKRCAEQKRFCFFSFGFIILCDIKQRMENAGGKSARKQSPNLQNFDLPSSGSGIECPPETGWSWHKQKQQQLQRCSQAKETGTSTFLTSFD